MEELSFKDLLFKELSGFARNNLKALEPAKQWLKNGTFDTLADVWQRAKEPFNWQKIVLIAWLASDEKIYTDTIDGFDPLILCPETHQQGFLYYVILANPNTNEPHPSLSLISNALDEGKRAKNDLIDLAKAIEYFDVSRTSLKRLIASGELKTYRKPPRGKHYISLQEAKHRLPVRSKFK